MTHVLLLRDGKVVARGPIDRTLTPTALSECFGMPLTLERRADGRFSAWVATSCQQPLPAPADLLG